MEPLKKTCPLCGGALLEGFVVDQAHGMFLRIQARWQRGVPEKSWWTGGIKSNSARQKPLVAMRCEKCTAVQCFAP